MKKKQVFLQINFYNSFFITNANIFYTNIIRVIIGTIHKTKATQYIEFNILSRYILRRERDSNPRTGRPVNGFRDRPIRPLWHLSFF